jgi:hypothetical protein
MAAMADNTTSEHRTFVSHSWKDKALARRVARRLSHRGVAIWIDEAEMQVGDQISQRLADEIRASGYLLVLLTKNATTSKWVAQEIDVAREARIPIIPVMAEPSLSVPLLDEVLAIDIIDPLTFEGRMDVLASALVGRPVSEDRERTAILRDLDAIGREAPDLRGLVNELLLHGKITYAQLNAVTVAEALRHPAETALIALHECADEDGRYVISLVAAKLYRELGVGYAVLERQLKLEPHGSSNLSTMFLHLGEKLERSIDLDGAFRLFQLASPPQDQAFTSFIRANFNQFGPDHRAQAVAFVVTPDRGPAGFAIDAAYELFARMPESNSLQNLWFFWVNDYKFGGKRDVQGGRQDGVFFTLMNEAAEQGLAQFDAVTKHFEETFRRLVRSSRIGGVMAAVSILTTAADRKYVGRTHLARQLSAALGSAEWQSLGRPDLWDSLYHLSLAVSSDASYGPALNALTEALRVARSN